MKKRSSFTGDYIRKIILADEGALSDLNDEVGLVRQVRCSRRQTNARSVYST
jgi:hypothetical protein